MGRRTREELIGSVIWDCFPELRGTVFETEMLRVARERAPSRFEFCHQRSGRWFDVRLSVVDEGVSVLGTEITESKRAETMLRDAQSELEARVAERTADLAQSNRALSLEVAERRRIERALRASEERFRKAFEDAAVGMAITDRAARFLARLERLVQPRWTLPFETTKRIVGFIILLLGISLLAPIPFSQVIPAAVIILLAFAWLEEDGLLLILALVAALISIAVTAGAIWGTVEAGLLL